MAINSKKVELTQEEIRQRTKEFAIAEMNSFNSAKAEPKDNIDCKECGNIGYIMECVEIGGLLYPVANECICTIERKNKKALTESGLDVMLTKKFDNYIVRDLLQRQVKDLAQENSYKKDWFFIGGQSGFGKTHICSAIANDILSRGQQVQYSIWTKDFKELNTLQVEKPDDYKWKKKKLQEVDYLYIDDLFKNKSINDLSNADVQLAFEIINYRYNNDKKTIISSEYTIQEIANVSYLEAIAGRIKEMCGKYVLNLSKDVNNNQRLNGRILELKEVQ